MKDCDWIVAVLADLGFFADLNGMEETSEGIDILLESLKHDIEFARLKGGLVPQMQRRARINDTYGNDKAEANWLRRKNTLSEVEKSSEDKTVLRFHSW